jgi:hypothetical protein
MQGSQSCRRRQRAAGQDSSRCCSAFLFRSEGLPHHPEASARLCQSGDILYLRAPEHPAATGLASQRRDAREPATDLSLLVHHNESIQGICWQINLSQFISHAFARESLVLEHATGAQGCRRLLCDIQRIENDARKIAATQMRNRDSNMALRRSGAPA